MEANHPKPAEIRPENALAKSPMDIKTIDTSTILIGIFILIMLVLIIYIIKMSSENKELKDNMQILSNQYRKTKEEKIQLSKEANPKSFMERMKREREQDDLKNKKNGNDPIKNRMEKDNSIRVKGRKSKQSKEEEEEPEVSENEEEIDNIVQEIEEMADDE